MKTKRVEIYDETYAGLVRIAVRTPDARGKVRYAGRRWRLRRSEDGQCWILGQPEA